MAYKLEERDQWSKWVTPSGLKKKAIHDWLVFPHSFTDELVSALIEEWGLTAEDRILDPFVGAGTTILTAKQKGIPATGYDLSPFAVHVARSKIRDYDLQALKRSRVSLLKSIDPSKWDGASKEYPQLVKDALPGQLLGAFDSIRLSIDSLRSTQAEKDLFSLALLRTLPKYSRAVPTGGWLSWVNKHTSVVTLKESFSKSLDKILDELEMSQLTKEDRWRVSLADARKLPDKGAIFTSVITSPPYPNRHDYTRVFGVELMFGFLDWDGTRDLRYQSFESHPEAHPSRPRAPLYKTPKALTQILKQIRDKDDHARISNLLSGYFLDMYLSLREVKRVCKMGAHIAYVVGNAQYFGVTVPVDELTAAVGELAGLKCDKIEVARYRGNSAQQMGKFGRKPSRESVVIFRKE